MSELAFEVFRIGFDELSRFASFEAFIRLGHGTLGPLTSLLLTDDRGGKVSDSAFMSRQAVVGRLAAMNPALPEPPAEATYVIGGQQPGLLTGPLYAFLKAVSCISLARELSASRNAVVLPLYWIASEDHDVLEVNRLTVNGRRFVHPYGRPITRGLVPQVADIPLRDARAPLLSFLEDALPETEFTPWVLEIVAALDYSNYASAYRSMLRTMFADQDMRIVDPISLRDLTGPVLGSLVERWSELEASLAVGSAALAAVGLDPPLSGLRLFEIVEGVRRPVERAAAGLKLSTGTCSFKEAAERIKREPRLFSPGAALRPLVQDATLPTVATVAGPTELAYLLQIAPLYDIAGVTPSPRISRICATLLEPGIQRAARKAGLPLERIFDAVGMLERPDEVLQDERSDAIARAGEELLALVDGLPHSPPPRWLRSARSALEMSLTRIRRRLHTEMLEKRGISRARLQKIADAIAPSGVLQERVVNVTQFLNLHGPDFVQCAVGSLDPLAHHHQIVAVGGDNPGGGFERQ